MRDLKFEPIWFDSLGAKSMASLVETQDVKIIIDQEQRRCSQDFTHLRR